MKNIVPVLRDTEPQVQGLEGTLLAQQPEAFAANGQVKQALEAEGIHGSMAESKKAMASGQPTITHDSLHFRWIAGSSPDARFVDMTCEGALRNALSGCWPPNPSAAQRSKVLSRFSWDVLLPEYVATYDRVLQLPVLR